MIHTTIRLPVQYREKGINNNGQTPELTAYLPDISGGQKNKLRPAMIICPGGGYEHLSQREGEAVALKMNTFGYNAFVLHYSLAPMDFPAALLDLCEAVYCVRTHAAEWHTNPEKIAVCGFSAGGHLAASFCEYRSSPLVSEYLPYSPEMLHPNALLLCYPVITAGKHAHKKSIENVLGAARFADISANRRDCVSLENHVNAQMPPVFIWHSDKDESVPVENSLLFAEALKKHRIPLELHIFRQGCHGMALATEETMMDDGRGVQSECRLWPELFSAWFNNL